MRLTIWLFGHEVITISTDQDTQPATEADGVEITRHSGSFELGFGHRQSADVEVRHS